uniref:Uncharacterized protein n=1 Tax=Timema douglasi TaxID=61478 RepID=A0A7R8ZAE4_TIMDO|nr:unnamed protein product [Timema douglasi]
MKKVRRHSATLHWFAHVGKEPETALPNESVVPSGKDNAEREERLRMLRDRQAEERQRKLEELKMQAQAAQMFREQKEEERRRRLEDLRQRDTDRRHQVEERKRQIWEAERDRREAILRKNQERETRIDTKRKNERSSIVFAFGSSMPRMLEPADTGGSFWGTRRATSTTNVMTFTAMPLTRRSSERELDGSKKRATSASGLDRKPGEDVKMSTSMYEIFHWDSAPGPSSHAPTAPRSLNLSGGRSRSYSSAPHTPSPRNASRGLSSAEEIEPATGETGSHNSSARVNRRKTDLMPTLPFPRDGARPGRAFSKSPGRAYSMSRLDQLAQPRRLPQTLAPLTEREPPRPPAGLSASSMSRSMSHLAGRGAMGRSHVARSMCQLVVGPVPPPRLTRAEKLRQKARDAAIRNQPQSTVMLVAVLRDYLQSLGSGNLLPFGTPHPSLVYNICKSQAQLTRVRAIELHVELADK